MSSSVQTAKNWEMSLKQYWTLRMQNVSKRIHRHNADGQQCFHSVRWQMNADALKGLWSKEKPAKKEKKSDVCHIRDCVRAAALICANKNIHNSQFVWVRTDSQFRVAQLNFKTILHSPHADQMLAAVLTCERPGYSKKSTGGYG